jgi:hypothetical protein
MSLGPITSSPMSTPESPHHTTPLTHPFPSISSPVPPLRAQTIRREHSDRFTPAIVFSPSADVTPEPYVTSQKQKIVTAVRIEWIFNRLPMPHLRSLKRPNLGDRCSWYRIAQRTGLNVSPCFSTNPVLFPICSALVWCGGCEGWMGDQLVRDCGWRVCGRNLAARLHRSFQPPVYFVPR